MAARLVVCLFLIGVVPVRTAAAQDAGSSGFLSGALSWTDSKIDGADTPGNGFYPKFGGMIPGSGLSVGPGYRHHFFYDRLRVDASASVSFRRYTMMQAKVEWPRAIGERVSLGAQVKRNDFTQINFFGVGDDTLKDDHTTYRLNYVDVGGYGTLQAARWLSLTGRAGVLRSSDVGHGRGKNLLSIEQRFDDQTAPGLARQPNYVHADVALEADTRDVPGYPSQGGRYRVSLASFRDREFSQYSFRRVEVEAAQYVPVTTRSALGVKARLDLSQTGAGQQVPFYLLPALGSSQSLRGYSDYRFRDRNSLLMTAEYRWPIRGPLDGAVFYDAGSVAPAFDGLMRHVRKAYGAGLRVHSKKNVLMRVDVARGNEGVRVRVSATPSLGFSNRMIAPFVP